jgi:multiple sugar transport system permease protein
VPFLWMLSTSLMDEFEVYQFPPQLLPGDPVWSNYPNALTSAPFARFFLNSAIMSLFIVLGQLFTAATAGYAFARLRFPGRDRVFILFLANLMVPVIVLLIPRFLLVNAFGWVDTYLGLIITELVSVWGIFLMRQYFLWPQSRFSRSSRRGRAFSGRSSSPARCRCGPSKWASQRSTASLSRTGPIRWRQP